MLLVLHGALKNVGDFLIRQRGVALLEHVRPDQRLVLVPRWEPVQLDQASAADAIVLCGGPGLAARFYPDVFPLVDDLEALTTPTLPLALGWSGQPVDAPSAFQFTNESRQALKVLHSRIGWSGVRDDLTLEIVNRASVGASRRTGCVAWYHLPSLHQPMTRPDVVRSLVVTPPSSRRLVRETISLLTRLARRYRGARRYCVFHRGLRPDQFTARKAATVYRSIAAVARALGYHVVDAAFDLQSVSFYRDVDLHVGYRVHAHLDFLSQRRPSLLISEDGRGVGQSVTLHDPYRLRAGSPQLVDSVDEALRSEQACRFEASVRAVDEIERSWPVMQETIQQLPER